MTSAIKQQQSEFDVDFVYSFIDGSDEKLIQRKTELLKSSSQKKGNNVNSATNAMVLIRTIAYRVNLINI